MPVNKYLRKIFKNKIYLTAVDDAMFCLFISIFSEQKISIIFTLFSNLTKKKIFFCSNISLKYLRRQIFKSVLTKYAKQ